MRKTLYFECYSGISGDMAVAALLDVGADKEKLDEVLKSLSLPGFRTEVSRVKKSGIDACDFNVILDEDNHDHDMRYLHGAYGEERDSCEGEHDHGDHYGHSHETEHDHGDCHRHSHEGEHTHENCHGHEHHGESVHREHVHRGMKEIREIIEAGKLTDGARELALKIFGILAKAEAKAHKVPVEEVHFHEVGAVDSIVDIVSVAVCLDQLGVDEVVVPVLYEGQGTVRCQHGILPIPVPAVSNIICEEKLNVKFTQVQGELVTPTGAAIAAAVRTSDKLPENFCIRKIGIGAGKRQYECPGILRVMLLESQEEEKFLTKAETDSIIKMETNIDDSTGETLGYVLEKLMKYGAKDVHYVPVFMKKNRPAWILNVICKEEDLSILQEIIFKETTTIGIRYTKMDRTILQREQHIVETPLGLAEVKVCTFQGEKYISPEYESVSRLSKEHEMAYRDVYKIVEESCSIFE